MAEYCPLDGTKLKHWYNHIVNISGYRIEYDVYTCEEGHVVVAIYDLLEQRMEYKVIGLDELDEWVPDEVRVRILESIGN